jgi:hypothetical protein
MGDYRNSRCSVFIAENLLKTIGYFWSDALNYFLFGHSPMTPTLMDVVMITGLDIASPSPSAYSLPEVPFRLSSKSKCTNWGAYLNQHVKTKGPMIEREHTTFLNFWLEHFIFCGPSLAPLLHSHRNRPTPLNLLARYIGSHLQLPLAPPPLRLHR